MVMSVVGWRKKIFLAVCLTVTFVLAQNTKPSEIEDVNIIEDNVGKNISLDRMFFDQYGNQVNLSNFAQDGDVLVINFVYFTCPMICGAASDGLATALSDLEMAAEKNYHVFSISINPDDDVDSASKYWEKHVKKAGDGEEKKIQKYRNKWSFLVSPDNSVKRFAEDLGFKYTKDKESGEFYHSTAVFVLNAEGLLSRILYGIAPDPSDLKLSILEASDNKYRTTLEKALLYCFTYDPNKNSYVVHAFNVMRAGGALTVLAILMMILVLRKKEPSVRE